MVLKRNASESKHYLTQMPETTSWGHNYSLRPKLFVMLHLLKINLSNF